MLAGSSDEGDQTSLVGRCESAEMEENSSLRSSSSASSTCGNASAPQSLLQAHQHRQRQRYASRSLPYREAHLAKSLEAAEQELFRDYPILAHQAPSFDYHGFVDERKPCWDFERASSGFLPGDFIKCDFADGYREYFAANIVPPIFIVILLITT